MFMFLQSHEVGNDTVNYESRIMNYESEITVSQKIALRFSAHNS